MFFIYSVSSIMVTDMPGQFLSQHAWSAHLVAYFSSHHHWKHTDFTWWTAHVSPSLRTFFIWKFLVFELVLKIQSTQSIRQRCSSPLEYVNLDNTFLYPFITDILIPLEIYHYEIYTTSFGEINLYMQKEWF